MNTKTLEELDYYRIRNNISLFCVSEEGQALLQEAEPLTDAQRITELKQLGNEWLKYLSSTRQSALSSWPKIEELFPIMKTQGATLLQDQVYALLQFCFSVKKVQQALASATNDLSLVKLPALAKTIPDLTIPENEISRIIDDDGEIKDLPELRAIRAKIAGFRRDIANLMKKYTSDQSLSGVLESNVPAFRADRQVLAVKSSRRTAVKGIIHEMSQSGQTVYIEPEDVVRKNNDLVQEEFHLQQEIRRIFHELTARLLPHTELFELSLPIMIDLDTTCAGAKWGKENRCTYAFDCKELNQENQTSNSVQYEPPLILQARHPLLGQKAVPIDVRFMSGKRTLIITGPNTGGKTVTLKTIALFSMLNQTGFPVPAAEGTRLPIFSDVFADIGDSQSLDQSLSTFSGHMKNIAQALKNADSNSLVLLDELGSGTDPLEGSAIAMAALDTLIERGAFILVTTHHGILKNYGYTHPSCINASVEFNDNTLSPTYKLIMGVPGESRALDIAKRSGLPSEICKKARSYIANEQADVSSLIKGLSAKHAEIDRLQNELLQKESEIADIRRKVDLHELRLRQKEMELKQNGHRESQQFLTESRKKLENLVRQLKEGEVTREKTLGVKSFINEITQEVKTQENTIDNEDEKLVQDMALKEKELVEQIAFSKKKKKTAKKRMKNAQALAAAQTPVQTYQETSSVPLEYKPGANVLAGSAKRPGTLLRQERKGLWSVQLGNIKMTIKEKDLILVPPDNKIDSTPLITVDLASDSKSNLDDSDFPGNKPMFELRLLGLRTDEAIKMLERQLDLCTMQNFKKFSIIHGKGAGILQQAVQDYLSHYPAVSHFSFAPPEDGGTGKTYVEMM